MKERNLKALITIIVKRVGNFLDVFCYVIPKFLMKFVANFATLKK